MSRLAEMVIVKVGEGSSVQAIVDYLTSIGLIDEQSIRAYTIEQEFFKRMRDPRAKSARDIEIDLAAEFDLSVRHVRRIRTRSLKKRT